MKKIRIYTNSRCSDSGVEDIQPFQQEFNHVRSTVFS